MVWHMDRLHRRPIELEEFVATCTSAGLTDVVTLHGDFDLGTGDGLLVARLMAAVAANESDAKCRRSERKMRRAGRGRAAPLGGGPRPFGFDAGPASPTTPSEAEVIRALAARVLAGESLTSLARWLHDDEVRTVTGKEWRTPTVRSLLLTPRIAGLRAHQGQVDRQGGVAADHHRRARAARAAADRPGPPHQPHRPQLPALRAVPLRQVRSEDVHRHAPRDRRRYMCRSGPDFGGCGGTMISATVEDLVTDAVLYRLDTPELAAAIAGRSGRRDSAALSETIAADTAQLDELAGLYAAKEITAAEWMSRPQTHRGPAHAATAAGKPAAPAQPCLAGHIGNGAALRPVEWPE